MSKDKDAVSEQQLTPSEAAAVKAADEIAKQGPKNRNKKVTKGKVFMPQSTSVDLSSIEGYRYEQVRDNEVWNHPEIMLKDPKPGAHYCWPKTDDFQTETRIASELYRPIRKDELKQSPIVKGATHKGTDDYVHRYGHILCEMTPKAYALFNLQPALQSIDRVARRQEQFEGEVEQLSQGGAVGKLTVSKHGTE